ncbi:hypothetical protein GDO78_017851 [Eleutherodactylus coqui]|uniref:Uncharacterized protein n=1 Tax=Eleutherodactylus coqui TaxID=57060 RepID=A0A8J6ECN8_ELECQ|nr:hypothetical protein GDO78_017851 [Eleutherodactylus coqui]
MIKKLNPLPTAGCRITAPPNVKIFLFLIYFFLLISVFPVFCPDRRFGEVSVIWHCYDQVTWARVIGPHRSTYLHHVESHT